MKKTNAAEEIRPVTVDDHRTLGNINAAKKINAVNDALKFPTGDQFEKDLTEILEGDYEEKGETVVIALIDFDEALEFYRGVSLIDAVGLQLGITPEQMTRFFETNDYKELLPQEFEDVE